MMFIQVVDDIRYSWLNSVPLIEVRVFASIGSNGIHGIDYEMIVIVGELRLQQLLLLVLGSLLAKFD